MVSYSRLVGSDQRRDPKGPNPQLFLFCVDSGAAVASMGSGDRHAPALEHADAILGGVLHVYIYGENQGRVRRCAISNWDDEGKERVGINVPHTV